MESVVSMKTYRSRESIISEILELTKGNGKKTHIMYGANLSYTLLVKYLDLLQKSKLLYFKESTQTFVLTEKGAKYLDLYKEVKYLQEGIAESTISFEKKREVLTKMFVEE